MKKKKAPKKMGRPILKLDWGMIDRMCAIQCTHEEIASLVGCHIDTLCNRCKAEHGMTFSEYLQQKKQPGKISLRRMQWKLAESGDKTMQIWLGKQYLGQSDKNSVDIGNKNDKALEVSVQFKKVFEDAKTRRLLDEVASRIAALDVESGSTSGDVEQ